MRTVLLVLLLSATATAAPLRLKVRPATGELIKTDRRCGKAAQRELWDRVFRAFYIELTERSETPDGAMSAGFESRYMPAARVVAAEPFVGFWPLKDGTTFSIAVRDRMRGKRLIPVAISILVQTDQGDACTETWLGLAERI